MNVSLQSPMKYVASYGGPYTEGKESPFPAVEPTSILTVKILQSINRTAWEQYAKLAGFTVKELAEGNDFRLSISIGALKGLVDGMEDGDRILLRTGRVAGFLIEQADTPCRSNFEAGSWIEIPPSDVVAHASAQYEDVVALLPKEDTPLISVRFRRKLFPSYL